MPLIFINRPGAEQTYTRITESAVAGSVLHERLRTKPTQRLLRWTPYGYEEIPRSEQRVVFGCDDVFNIEEKAQG